MAVFELLSLQVRVLRQFAHVCHSVNMEWGVKENHVAVVALHNCGKSHSQIFKSYLIRDDHPHMTAHHCSKGNVLTPALKAIRRTRAEHQLQWHAENGHENILFTDKKIFTNQEQYNNQDNKIYAQTSLEVRSEGAGRPSPFLHHGMVGGCPIRG
jgi:hypothetical protein